MIKTLASCHFDVIRDILASLFSLLSVIKAAYNWMICLCSNSWHHLLSKSPTLQVHTTASTFVLFITISKPSSANEGSSTTLSIRLLSWHLSWSIWSMLYETKIQWIYKINIMLCISEINDNITFFCITFHVQVSSDFTKNLHIIKFILNRSRLLKTCIGTVLCTAAL